ncbi:iron complex transport system permease protein [Promicromonospora umidemergens]|uniref:Iron chelate uptake ABC transporter family permease subunit n=1 Tax=Promicromonospora umidemergens TaxID=629679 RepID=A0ABP8X986_9MICO|nr:iron chelate uptake ABC transporter family permease subunit [Promicromonospora umidemergens]MCP2281363.1 iron complex transport system permease protein [Promicromonospora umidemergens]
MSTSTSTAVADLRTVRRRRQVLVVAGMILVVLVAGTGALLVGAAGLSPGQAIAGALGLGDKGDVFIIQKLRLPRIEAAVVVGAAFGLAGALFQATLRNPLASPDILGISSGASLGAVIGLLALGLSGVALSGLAFAGAGIIALAIWLLAWRKGLHSIRFVLVGVGFAYLCSSLLAWAMARSQEHEAAAVLTWTVGSVSDIRGEQLALVAAGTLVLSAAVAVVARLQGPLSLGDDNARALGVHVDAARIGTLLLAVALVALATSAAGPIAFVALVAPAIARRLVNDGGAALTASTATGAALTLVADVVGQHALLGVAAPVGIVTGLVGAPYLLWLLATTEKRSR